MLYLSKTHHTVSTEVLSTIVSCGDVQVRLLEPQRDYRVTSYHVTVHRHGIDIFARRLTIQSGEFAEAQQISS